MNLLLNDGCFTVIRQNGDYIFGSFFLTFFVVQPLPVQFSYPPPTSDSQMHIYLLISSHPRPLPIKLFQDRVPSYCVPVLPTNQFSLRFFPFILEMCLSKVLAWQTPLVVQVGFADLGCTMIASLGQKKKVQQIGLNP